MDNELPPDARLSRPARRGQNGATVELDLTSANKIVELLDLLIHYERNFER